MTYDPNAPGANNSIADWQKMFLDNFSVLFDTFKNNHISLDAGSTSGNHGYIQLFEQKEGPQTGLDELSIYSKSVPGQTDQMFLRYRNNGTEVQLTNYQIYALPKNTNELNYFTFLPGKVLINFGSFKATGSSYTLNIRPGISRNIISISICAAGSTPAAKPFATFTEEPRGYYSLINFQQTAPGFTYNFFVMYNI